MKIFITSYLSMNNNFDHLVRGKCWLRFQKVHVLILVILLYVRVIQFLLPKREKYIPNKPNKLFSKTSYENTFDFFDRHYILHITIHIFVFFNLYIMHSVITLHPRTIICTLGWSKKKVAYRHVEIRRYGGKKSFHVYEKFS